MAAERAILADAGWSGCEGCDDGDDCTADVGTCVSLCASAVQGLLPDEAIASPPTSGTAFDTVGLILGGWSHSPEHDPPKLLVPADA
jgi:hypothetical protein